MTQKNKNHLYCHNRHFFSLTELLIIIAIIFILFSLLSPALRKSIVASKSIRCLNNLKQIAVGIDYYTEDHFDYLPVAYPGGSVYGLGGPGNQAYYGWRSRFVLPYYLTPKILEEYPGTDDFGLSYHSLKLIDTVFDCPSDQGWITEVSNEVKMYGWNIKMGSNMDPGQVHLLKTVKVDPKSIILSDIRHHNGTTSYLSQLDPKFSHYTTLVENSFGPRHGEYGNVLSVDGASKSYVPEEIIFINPVGPMNYLWTPEYD